MMTETQLLGARDPLISTKTETLKKSYAKARINYGGAYRNVGTLFGKTTE
ncbi:hypothetical protein [Niabella hibiscisoli]|nr:hypothetical protein [Niabella hibiscisoli]MCH5714940.1 hypothetical protein [Niabella hibiscisoli]